jgi:protoheme ferro-lyase
MKKAVILFNLGGPDKLENVEPFYSIYLMTQQY